MQQHGRRGTFYFNQRFFAKVKSQVGHVSLAVW
jgi:hypothetical protein